MYTWLINSSESSISECSETRSPLRLMDLLDAALTQVLSKLALTDANLLAIKYDDLLKF